MVFLKSKSGFPKVGLSQFRGCFWVIRDRKDIEYIGYLFKADSIYYFIYKLGT